MASDLDTVRRLVAADQGLAIVAVARPNGTIHSSLVNAGVLDDARFGGPTVAFVTQGRAKKLGWLRDGQPISVAFRAGWDWVSVEGPVDLAGPDDTRIVDAGDVPELLRAVFRSAGGTHDDWDEFDRVMAAERRTAVLVHPERILSNG